MVLKVREHSASHSRRLSVHSDRWSVSLLAPLIKSSLPSGDIVFSMYKDIDLTNPKLGKGLSKDALGQLPYDVWLKYVCEHNGERSEVLSWCVDPDDPDVAPIDPQQAVDQALPLVRKS